MAIRKSRPLEGQTALVTGGGEGVGRAIALALAARGVRIVVVGANERLLGETVGYVAHAGGKARHVVADVGVASEVDAAVARAVAMFGGLDIVIASSDAERGGEASGVGARHLVASTLATVNARGRLLAVRRGDRSVSAAGSADAAFVRTLAMEAARDVTCNLVTAAREDVEDAVAELVVFLCASTGDAITGQSIEVGGPTT